VTPFGVSETLNHLLLAHAGNKSLVIISFSSHFTTDFAHNNANDGEEIT